MLKKRAFSPFFLAVLFFVCVFLALISVSFSSSQKEEGDIVLQESVKNLRKQAEEYEKTVSEKVKNRARSPELEKKAEEAYGVYQSPEFQAKVKEYQAELQKLFNKNGTTVKVNPRKYYEDFYEYSKDVLVLSDDEVMYVFVSSSMPREVIREYLASVEKVEGEVNFVLRGGVKGLKYLRTTIEYVANLLKKDENCDFTKAECEVYSSSFLIDPLLFREFGIKTVPAVVYKGKGVEVISYGAVSFKRHVKRIGEALKDERFLTFGDKT